MLLNKQLRRAKIIKEHLSKPRCRSFFSSFLSSSPKSVPYFFPKILSDNIIIFSFFASPTILFLSSLVFPMQYPIVELQFVHVYSQR